MTASSVRGGGQNTHTRSRPVRCGGAEGLACPRWLRGAAHASDIRRSCAVGRAPALYPFPSPGTCGGVHTEGMPSATHRNAGTQPRCAALPRSCARRVTRAPAAGRGAQNGRPIGHGAAIMSSELSKTLRDLTAGTAGGCAGIVVGHVRQALGRGRSNDGRRRKPGRARCRAGAAHSLLALRSGVCGAPVGNARRCSAMRSSAKLHRRRVQPTRRWAAATRPSRAPSWHRRAEAWRHGECIGGPLLPVCGAAAARVTQRALFLGRAIACRLAAAGHCQDPHAVDSHPWVVFGHD